jgi:hypothetical protein
MGSISFEDGDVFSFEGCIFSMRPLLLIEQSKMCRRETNCVEIAPGV